MKDTVCFPPGGDFRAWAANSARCAGAFFLAFLIFTGGSFLGGCGRSREKAGMEEEIVPIETMEREAPQERAPSPEAVKRDALGAGFAMEEEEVPTAGPEEDIALQALERRRVYSGFCELLVGSVDETREELFRTAEEQGGYVESVAGNTVVLRVPAESFQAVFELVLALGEVVDSSVETIDVTEQFTDLEARLEVARKTRERLYALLERTTDVEERLKILREIRRLTEQIEQISQNLQLLESRVAFSRITVQLVPRLGLEQEAQGQDKSDIPFRWIAGLDPLYVSLSRLRGRAAFEPGEEFAVFEREKSYRAESTDGTRIRIGSTENEPRGDGLFWQQALGFHLKDYYRSAEKFQAGEVRGILFASKDDRPFFYLVGVRVSGKTLYVVEVFFPDKEALAARRGAVMGAIQGLRIKGLFLP